MIVSVHNQFFFCSFGQGPRFKADAYRKLSTHSFVNMSGTEIIPKITLFIYRDYIFNTIFNNIYTHFYYIGSLQFKSMGITPALNISIGNHLGANTVGYLTYSTNWRVSEYNDVSLHLYLISIYEMQSV